MSSVLSDVSTTPAVEFLSPDGSLTVIGEQDQTNLFIVEGNGDDCLVGGELTDIIDGGAGDDNIIGQAGSDKLSGGEGDDVIVGDAGDDIISGGAGEDVMTGGEGSDIFEFFTEELTSEGIDDILDFTEGEDIILIKGAGGSTNISYNSSTGTVSIDGEDVLQLDEGLDLSTDASGEDFELF